MMCLSAKNDNEICVFKSFCAGGFGGMCSVAVGHPFDTIKVRLQTATCGLPNENPLYCSTLDCARKTLENEGFRGLYRGMLMPLIGAIPLFAVCFLGFNLGTRLFSDDPGDHKKHEVFCAGMLSGVFTTVITAPGERIKCLLQIENRDSHPKYSGPIDVAKRLYHEGGVRSIFKGTTATLLRDVPASGVFFLSYEWIREFLKPKNSSNCDLGIARTIFAGGTAGVFNWLVAIPPDVLKSRIQTAPPGKYPKGMRSAFRELVVNEGVSAFYKGVIPIMIRAFPANAACFLGYETALRALSYF